MKTISPNISRSCAILLLAMFMLPGMSKASSIWVGKMSSSWQDAMNWFPVRVPGPSDDVIIQVFAPGVAPVLDLGQVRLKSLEISISGKLTARPGTTLTVLGNTEINGTFTTSGIDLYLNGNLRGNGTLDASSSNIYLKGSMTIQYFTARTSTVILNGSAVQDLTGYYFWNLTVANTSSGVMLLKPVTVRNSLAILNGKIDLGGQTMTLGQATTLNGSLTVGNGFFTGNGAFKRWFGSAPISATGTAGLFPMSSNGFLRYVTISGAPLQGGTVAVSHTDNMGTYYFNPTYTEKNGALVVNTRCAPRWTVATGNGFDGSVDLGIRADGINSSADYHYMTVSLANSPAPGIYVDPIGNSKNPVANRVRISAADLNNDFYVAFYHTVSSPTAVVISNTDNTGGTSLSWNTQTENGFVRYDVERSSDATNWYSIGSVDAYSNAQMADASAAINPNLSAGSEGYSYTDNIAGNSGAMYYRVKLVKADGYYEYSEAKSVVIPFSLLAYPNPVTDLLHLKWEGSEFENAELHITDMNGRIMYEQNINGHGVSDIQIDIAGYKPGNYIVKLFSGTQSVSKIISKH